MGVVKKKKILLLLTGGTICSSVCGNCRTLKNSNARAALIDRFQGSSSPYADKVEFTVLSDRGIFSENMTIDRYNELIDLLRSSAGIIGTARKRSKHILGLPAVADNEVCFDGIIIAHGTDTLGFSAPLFSLLLSKIGVPVFLVAANEPLSSAGSNGHDNFRFAVELIGENIAPDVYVPYRNPSDGILYLHSAERLCQCRSREGDFFSVDMADIRKGEKIPRHRSNSEEYGGLFGAWHLNDDVMILHPYVGLNYDRLDISNTRAVIHEAYHSGTLCTEQTETHEAYGPQSILRLIDRLSSLGKEKGASIPLIITPSRLTGEVYDTVPRIKQHADRAGNVPLYFCDGDSTELLYAKLLLAGALGLSTEKTLCFLGC